MAADRVWLFDALPRDVTALMCSCLAAADLRQLARVGRAARGSLFREKWLQRVRLLVPPNDAVAACLIGGLDEIAARGITQVSLADPTHLQLVKDKLSASLTQLRVSGDGYMASSYEPILRLKWLDQFQRLTILDLSGSAIVGVSDLTKLTQLIELDVSFTLVVDISPLASMTKLQVLNLESTRVKSIKAVRCMPELRVLNLNTTKSLRKLTPIASLKKLTTLSIDDKDLLEVDSLLCVAPSLTSLDAIDVKFLGEDVALPVRQDALSSLALLESFRTWPMSWTQTLGPLVPLTHLKTLDLRFPPFTDLDPLQALVNLEDLRLMVSATRDTAPLRVLKKLKKLMLAGCSHDPHSLEFLVHLPELRALSLSGEIHSQVISRLVHLETLELNFSSASWDAIPPAERFPQSMWTALVNVKTLALRVPVGAPADLSGLSCMTQLEYLDLRYATPRELPTASYFEFLASLVNLRELRLAGGGIRDLSDLRNLKHLEYLDLTSTNVANIELLASLTNLRNVELGYTRVADVMPLTRLQLLARVVLPIEASCSSLARADLPELRCILHEHLNCLWNDDHRRRYDHQEGDDDVDSDHTALRDLAGAFGEYTGDY